MIFVDVTEANVLMAVASRRGASQLPTFMNVHFHWHFYRNLLGTHQFELFCTSTIFISSTFSVLRPLYFLFTSTRVLRPLYFDSLTSTFCQIWTSYLSISTGRNTVLVEVKSVESRSTEKVEDMKMVEVQKRSK